MKCWLALLLSSPALAQMAPNDTAAAFVTAVDRGDAAAVAALIEHEPNQQAAAMALARNLIAARRLAGVLHDRYGPTADPLGAAPLPTTQQIRDASVAADASRAALHADGMTLSLHQTDGTWKLVLLDGRAAGVQQVWLTHHLAIAMTDCADEILAGRHASLDAARHALQLKMGAVVTKVMVNDSITTRPTTMP